MSGCLKWNRQSTPYYDAVRIVNRILDECIINSMNYSKTEWNKLSKILANLSQAYGSKKMGHELYQGLDVIVAYLVGYTPRLSRALFDLLYNLFHCGLLSNRFNVLDIGSGCGTSIIGLAYMATYLNLRQNSRNNIKLDAVFVDVSDDAMPIREIVAGTCKSKLEHFQLSDQNLLINLELGTTNENIIEKGPYDIIIIGSVLNEIKDYEARKRVLRIAGQSLKVNGNLIIVESAYKPERSVSYRQECQEFCREEGFSIVGPCINDCRAGYCWTYVKSPMLWSDLVRRKWNPPLYEYRYSYLLLRKDGKSRFRATDLEPLSPGTKSEIHTKILVTNNINLKNNPGNYYTVCDGFSNPIIISTPAPLRYMNELHEIKISNPQWGIKLGSHLLNINASDSINPIGCRSFISSGSGLMDLIFGELKIISVEGCMGAAIVEDSSGKTFSYDLRSSFDSLRCYLL